MKSWCNRNDDCIFYISLLFLPSQGISLGGSPCDPPSTLAVRSRRIICGCDDSQDTGNCFQYESRHVLLFSPNWNLHLHLPKDSLTARQLYCISHRPLQVPWLWLVCSTIRTDSALRGWHWQSALRPCRNSKIHLLSNWLSLGATTQTRHWEVREIISKEDIDVVIYHLVDWHPTLLFKQLSGHVKGWLIISKPHSRAMLVKEIAAMPLHNNLTTNTCKFAQATKHLQPPIPSNQTYLQEKSRRKEKKSWFSTYSTSLQSLNLEGIKN